MATDRQNKWIEMARRGTPFFERVTSADASGNGAEVKAAETGKTLYVLGYQISNTTAGALTYFLVHTAAAAGKTQINVMEHVATVTTKDSPRFEPPIAGAVGVNIGFVASGAGATQFSVWGYSL